VAEAEEVEEEVAEEDEEAREEVAKVGALKEDEVVEESAAVVVVVVTVDSWIVVGGRTTMVTNSKPEKTSKMEWRLSDGTQKQNDLPPPPRVDCGDVSGFWENSGGGPILSMLPKVSVCVLTIPPPC
jgi:hypothetical protein